MARMMNKMVDIISANEASEIARKHDNSDKIVEDFLDMANAVIKNYAEKGRYNVELSCISASKGYVYNKIKEALTAKGYKVDLNYPFIKIKW
jgi:hypothetical protein